MLDYVPTICYTCKWHKVRGACVILHLKVSEPLRDQRLIISLITAGGQQVPDKGGLRNEPFPSSQQGSNLFYIFNLYAVQQQKAAVIVPLHALKEKWYWLMDVYAFLQIIKLHMCRALISSFIIPMTKFELCAGEFHHNHTWIYHSSRKPLIRSAVFTINQTEFPGKEDAGGHGTKIASPRATSDWMFYHRQSWVAEKETNSFILLK